MKNKNTCQYILLPKFILKILFRIVRVPGIRNFIFREVCYFPDWQEQRLNNVLRSVHLFFNPCIRVCPLLSWPACARPASHANHVEPFSALTFRIQSEPGAPECMCSLCLNCIWIQLAHLEFLDFTLSALYWNPFSCFPTWQLLLTSSLLLLLCPGYLYCSSYHQML